MHQIYSCSDENLEVFTVISSKCEYHATRAIARENDFIWLRPTGSKEIAFSNLCSGTDCTFNLSIYLSRRAKVRQRSICIQENNSFSTPCVRREIGFSWETLYGKV
uniref:Uncharacterized protein n=1 Tax=Podarcis muralis TaxID=64176 RepID=A0A670IHH1_PODMU